jgi:ParB family chromosome partitioning protein
VKKQVLGRGLGALIDDASIDLRPSHQASAINEIDVNTIIANPYQPRKEFDDESINELAESIKQLGIIQPITVRKIDEDKYQLITGERRFRASKIAGLTTIPAYVRTADDMTLLEMALVENIQREDLNPIEIAISYQRLIEECNITQENLAERVGKKRSTVANYLRILKLPAQIQLGIREDKISIGHAKVLLNIDDEKLQIKVYNQILKKSLSVRQVEDLLKNLSADGTKIKKSDSDSSKGEEYKKLSEHLKNIFGSKVEFKRNVNGNGKIIIPFYSDEELERILSIFENINK